MTPRAAFIYWSLAENEPERVLDDLARWTRINTVIVASSYSRVDDPREASPFDRVFWDPVRAEVSRGLRQPARPHRDC